jgi:PAS domain-containing protein
MNFIDSFWREKSPTLIFLRALSGKNGLLTRFQWTFINLSSNSDRRYCLAKGKRHFTLGELMYAKKYGESTTNSQGDLGFVETILRNSNDMLAILDSNRVYKFISASIIDKLGVNPEAVIGKSVDSFIEKGSIGFLN